MSLYRRYTVEGKQPGPRLLILAGVHGDECEPMLAVSQLRTELNAEKLSGKVTLIPVANESAYNRAARTGEDGMDLARTFPGSPNGSITERLAAQLTEEIQNADFLIDLHTGGTKLDILPMTGFMLHSNELVLAKQRFMAETFGLPIIWGTSAELAGRTLSAARDADVPAIYTEQWGGGRFRSDTVDAYVAGCIQVIAALGMTEPVPAANYVQHRIDDRATHSGHLQAGHPSPADGVFLPAVTLGERLRAGQEIGQVANPITNERAPVTAERDGTVLMLYASPQVSRGTGLCVLIDLQAERQASR